MSNKEVLKTAGLPSREFILLQVQLGWANHVTRLDEVHMPKGKTVFLSKLQELKKESVILVLHDNMTRPAEETACTGRKQPLVMAAVGLRSRQLVLISEKSLL